MVKSGKTDRGRFLLWPALLLVLAGPVRAEWLHETIGDLARRVRDPAAVRRRCD